MQKKITGRPPIGPMPPEGGGPHSLLTDSEREKVIEAIQGGAGRIMACMSLAVGFKRFTATVKQDAEFRAEVEDAESFKDEICLAVIYAGASQANDQKSAETYLKIRLSVKAMLNQATEARKSRKLKERELELAHGGKRDDSRPDLSRLDDAELAEYRRLLAKLGVAAEPDPSGVTIDVEGSVVPDAQQPPDPQPQA